MSRHRHKTRKSPSQGSTLQKQPPSKYTNAARIVDSFSNPMARMGVDTPNLMESSGYVRKNITGDYSQLNVLYRQNWIVQRLINTIPHDMLKNWYKIKSQMEPSALQALRRLERMTGVRDKVLEALQWGRLYGGAAAIMIIDGHDDYLHEPLDFDLIMPDSFKGLIVLDRWSGITPEFSLVTDIHSPDFGLPAYYTISDPAYGHGVQVHHSRVLRFIGTKLPPVDEIAESYWGATIIEHVLEEIKKYDNTSYNIAMLVFKACLRIYAIDNMDELGAMDETALSELYNTLTGMNWMMNNQGMQIINAKDRFETQQYSFGGLSEVMELFMLDIAGAAEIPVTKLFGRAPAGMNATGESDLQNYYDSVDEKQETELRPVFDRLLPVMCMSLFGAIPDDLDYDFVSSRRPTEEERKNISTQVSTAVIGAYNAGIIHQRTALKELRESSDITGMWNNITDEDIENADEAFRVPDEYSEIAPELAETLYKEDAAVERDIPPPESPSTLNGAQVSSMVAIVQSVSSGGLPRESGIAMIMAAFGYDREKADEVMGSAGDNIGLE